MARVKKGSWLHDLIEVYNDLGGTASYSDVYELAKERRQKRGASWTTQARASIRRTVEDHAKSSANFRGTHVFYSVKGHGAGVWGLMPEYVRSSAEEPQPPQVYAEGAEGIQRERVYMSRSRDPRLVEARKERDDFTCQVCQFRLVLGQDKYVIDVHHLRPLGVEGGRVLTSIDDLVCLCPTCHRIAHSRREAPLPLAEIKRIRNSA